MTKDVIYVSTSPITIEAMMLATGWYLADEEDGWIEDGKGNEAWVLETLDGHVELFVDDDQDISELLEAVPFERGPDESE